MDNQKANRQTADYVQNKLQQTEFADVELYEFDQHFFRLYRGACYIGQINFQKLECWGVHDKTLANYLIQFTKEYQAAK